MAVLAETAAAPETRSLAEKRIAVATQWQLMWWRFRKHKLAMGGTLVLVAFYLVALFADFFAYTDPQRLGRAAIADGAAADPLVRRRQVRAVRLCIEGNARSASHSSVSTSPDPATKLPIRFFARGEPYTLLGFIPMERHLFGVEGAKTGATLFLMGTDVQGRDLWSRLMFATRTSMTIGLVSVALSLVLGVLLGGISGYFGGVIDTVIQRIIEILRSIPTIPLWMGLAAAVPNDWSVVQVYFAITIIISLIGWTELARVVRGRFLSLRKRTSSWRRELVGCSKTRIIFRHMVPSFISHIIAATTLAIPAMIISETSLSFLGLGLRPPAISWGVLLQDAQNIQALVISPWLLYPVRRRHRRRPRVQFHGRRDARRRGSLFVVRRYAEGHEAAAFGAQPQDAFLSGRGHDQGRRRRVLRRAAGKDPRHRRRERLRQERHRAIDPAHRRSSRAHRRGRDPARAARTGRETDLVKLKADGREIRSIRGGEIGLIFQEPMTSFSPVHTVGDQIIEAVMLHNDVGRKEARRRGIEALRSVGIPRPERRIDEYSFELSGGLRQRAMIAIALSCDPRLLIADEPTTALDVTTQAQILDLLRRIQQERGMAIMLITHNLGVVAEMADDVVVMYLGRVVEQGKVDDIFHDARHPYTRALLQSIPSIESRPRVKLPTISGSVPHPFNRPTGCPFHPRCESFMPGAATPRNRLCCPLEMGGWQAVFSTNDKRHPCSSRSRGSRSISPFEGDSCARPSAR